MSRASSARESKPSTSVGTRPYIGWLAYVCLVISYPPNENCTGFPFLVRGVRPRLRGGRVVRTQLNPVPV